MDNFFDVCDLTEDILQFGLINNCLKVTDGVDELRTSLSIYSQRDGMVDGSGDADVSEADTFANDEGASRQMCLESVERPSLALNECVVGL